MRKVGEWAKEKLITEEINKNLLLATDNYGLTAWHVAVSVDNLEALKEAWGGLKGVYQHTS
jgi:hypothetical protein